jgi:hypothetical protein
MRTEVIFISSRPCSSGRRQGASQTYPRQLSSIRRRRARCSEKRQDSVCAAARDRPRWRSSRALRRVRGSRAWIAAGAPLRSSIITTAAIWPPSEAAQPGSNCPECVSKVRWHVGVALHSSAEHRGLPEPDARQGAAGLELSHVQPLRPVNHRDSPSRWICEALHVSGAYAPRGHCQKAPQSLSPWLSFCTTVSISDRGTKIFPPSLIENNLPVWIQR